MLSKLDSLLFFGVSKLDTLFGAGVVSKLDTHFSSATGDIACKILFQLCQKSNVHPENTTLGIYGFAEKRRIISTILDTWLPFTIFLKLEVEAQSKIVEWIVEALHRHISENSLSLPLYNYYFHQGIIGSEVSEQKKKIHEVLGVMPLPTSFVSGRASGVVISLNDHQINMLKSKLSIDIPKPMNVMFPELFLREHEIFLVLEQTMVDINRHLEKIAPGLYKEDIEKKHGERICKKSIESFALDILIRVAHYAGKDKPIRHIETLIKTLVKVIDKSMRYSSLVELSENNKRHIRNLLASRLFALSSAHDSIYDTRDYRGDEYGIEKKYKGKGIRCDGIIYSDGTYDDAHKINFPEGLFLNEDEMKKQLAPVFERIVDRITVRYVNESKVMSFLSEHLPQDSIREICSHLTTEPGEIQLRLK